TFPAEARDGGSGYVEDARGPGGRPSALVCRPRRGRPPRCCGTPAFAEAAGARQGALWLLIAGAMVMAVGDQFD
ncbi:hypothetical protein ACIQVT_26265, partial [Streptomyces sp. NPDC100445]